MVVKAIAFSSYVVFILCILISSPRQGVSSLSIPGSKVIVTGAAGRTGRLVFERLLNNERFACVAIVRTENSARKLVKSVKCGLEQVIVADVANADEMKNLSGCEGAECMIICTSAVPQIIKRSLVKPMLNKLLGRPMGRPLFRYRPGQYPEKVDYEGQIAQIDLAKRLGVKQVIIVSSMGVTDPSNFLNSIGKDKNGEGNGDILIWKRKAEKYLVDSGLNYSIIHPGGLKDTPAGVKQIDLDVDDELLKREQRSISRGDVADLCVACLTVGKGKNISFDAVSTDVAEGSHVTSAEKTLEDFLKTGKTANYDLTRKTTDMSKA